MRKLSKFFVLFLALAALTCTSCKKQKGAVLDYVPADASVFFYGDLNYVLEKVGFAEDGSIKEPLRGALEQNGVDISDYKKEMALVKDFTKDVALFIQNSSLWIVAGMSDQDDMIKFLKDKHNFSEDKEEGVKLVYKDGGTMMFKDNMLFMCFNIKKGKLVSNPSGVKDLCKLGNDSFSKSEKTKALAEKITKGDLTFYGLANFNKIGGMIRDFGNYGASEDYDNFKAGLSMIYTNPTYVSLDMKVGDEGVYSTLQVLDSSLKPAKCSINLGQIDTKAIANAAVPNNSIAGAVALPASLINQIKTAFGNAINTEMNELLSLIDGTIAFTANPKATAYNIFAVAVACKNGADAQKLGSYLPEISRDLDGYTAGNYLRVIRKTGPVSASGNTAYASVLQGKAAGYVMDFGLLAQSMGLSGDFAQLGTTAVYLDTADGSLCLKSEWKCKNPVQRIFDIINNARAIDRALNSTDFDIMGYEEVYEEPDSIFGYETEIVEPVSEYYY